MQKVFENESNLPENERARKTHFHMNSLAQEFLF